MNRKDFLNTSLQGGLGCCAFVMLESVARAADPPPQQSDADREKEFLKNWMADLFETIDTELDEKTKVKLMAGCGKGCFRRFSFKQDIARSGKGSVDNLVAAYKKNFECWREGKVVHIRYGAVSNQCYCPAARYHPALKHDVHCECTRATHQAVFETALERPVRVEVVESLRRGGKTCHFVAHVG
jgi:hypothetical protein